VLSLYSLCEGRGLVEISHATSQSFCRQKNTQAPFVLKKKRRFSFMKKIIYIALILVLLASLASTSFAASAAARPVRRIAPAMNAQAVTVAPAARVFTPLIPIVTPPVFIREIPVTQPPVLRPGTPPFLRRNWQPLPPIYHPIAPPVDVEARTPAGE